MIPQLSQRAGKAMYPLRLTTAQRNALIAAAENATTEDDVSQWAMKVIEFGERNMSREPSSVDLPNELRNPHG